MRVIDFSDGFTNASAPSSGSLVTVTGSRAAPTSITAGGGIVPAGVASELAFVQGSGGAVDITANPQIAAGTTVGQILTLVGRSDTNTLKLDDATGLSMNGSCTLAADWVISFVWDGTNWVETGRAER